MVLLKTIRSRHFIKLLKVQNPLSTSITSSISSEILFISSIFPRPFSLADQFATKSVKESQKYEEPLSDFFKSAISAPGRTNSGGDEPKNGEIAKLKEKLRNLEEVVRSLSKERGENGKTPRLISAKSNSNEQSGAKVKLSAFFTNKKKDSVKFNKATDFGNEDPMVYKEISCDMQVFTHHLYMEGYFKDANFMPKNEFDVTCFEHSYGREFLKFAAVKYGEDHQEIAKWLSASDLKNVALFGCPSRGRRSVSAAKHMRSFFGIEERKVCQTCPLNESCKFANKKCKNYTQLDLAKVMRVLIMYAMESVPQQLAVPEDVNASVSRLLKEIVNLSRTTS
ncbi:hypothetical protein OROGR_015414 [Orobanche gracilis]